MYTTVTARVGVAPVRGGRAVAYSVQLGRREAEPSTFYSAGRPLRNSSLRRDRMRVALVARRSIAAQSGHRCVESSSGLVSLSCSAPQMEHATSLLGGFMLCTSCAAAPMSEPPRRLVFRVSPPPPSAS